MRTHGPSGTAVDVIASIRTADPALATALTTDVVETLGAWPDPRALEVLAHASVLVFGKRAGEAAA